jgi:hypothetical protein
MLTQNLKIYCLQEVPVRMQVDFLGLEALEE